MPQTTFLKRLLILSAILAIISFGVSQILPPSFVPIVWPFMLLFFIAVGILAHKSMSKAIRERPARSVNFFMLIAVIKLFVYMGIIIVYALSYREQAAPFIVWFFVYYLVFTFFEVSSILLSGPKNP